MRVLRPRKVLAAFTFYLYHSFYVIIVFKTCMYLKYRRLQFMYMYSFGHVSIELLACLLSSGLTTCNKVEL